MNACSGPIWAGWVPPPRPMNQRTTVPPLGPGPAAIGAGVMLTVDGDGSGVAEAAAATDAAVEGDGLADDWQAVASRTTIAIRAIQLRGADRERSIAIDSSSVEIWRSPPLRVTD